MTVCRLTDLSSIFTYQGEETCAADGMCQVKCPVKINTGELIKHIRHENLGGQQTRAQKTAMVRARPYLTCTMLCCYPWRSWQEICADPGKGAWQAQEPGQPGRPHAQRVAMASGMR